MANVELYIIGIEEGFPISSSTTKKQIDGVRTLECQLELEGESLSWDFFDDPNEPRTLFQAILRDREMRVDRTISVENNPPFCVVTSMEGKAVRLEFYEGSHELRLRFDIRSRALERAEMPNYLKDVLAQPIQIGAFQAKNRILMPPMYRPWSGSDGKVGQRHVEHYRERAQAGVGTIVVETTAVRREYRLGPNNIGIWQDEQIDGLAKIAEAIRSNNALAFIQINHTPVMGALSAEEIALVRNAFVDAAIRAERADFHGVEVHAAHGFLLSRLLAPGYNQQKDEYGGDVDGRVRLLIEIISLVREKTGPDFASGVRLGIDDLENGLDIAKKLAPLSDYLSISNGAEGGKSITLPPDYPFSPTVYRAEKIKPHVGVPVVAVGEIKTGRIARRILSKGIADMIAVGRGLLADAEWAEKALNYRDDDIQPL